MVETYQSESYIADMQLQLHYSFQHGCQTQSNCVSVSASKNPTQFGAPWDFTTQTTDPDKVGHTRVLMKHMVTARAMPLIAFSFPDRRGRA